MVGKESLEQITQHLYEQDGHNGNVYKKASPIQLREYENRAIDLMDDETEQVYLGMLKGDIPTGDTTDF